MEKRSKTNKEIFEEKYSINELSNSPLVCSEAIGYLKAIIQYFPSEKWAEIEKSAVLLLLARFYSV